MNWLPSILNRWSAAIAAGVVVPSLLLLYFLKLRRKEMPIGSTLLWKKSVQDLQVNAPFQRLRRNLLLFLQLAALLALILAFARPVSFQQTSKAEQTLILIDRSASMNARDVDGRTRLEEAKRRAADRIDSLPKRGRAAVIAFDSSAEVVQQMTDDRQALKGALDRIEPTDQSTRLKMAYQLAEAATGLDPEQMRAGLAAAPDLYVYSDGRVLDGGELQFNGRVTYEKIGTDAAGNIAIVALSARRNYERPNEVTVFARLANYGPQAVTADLELSVAELDPAEPAKLDFQTRQVKESATLLPDRFTEDQRKQAESAGTISRDSVEFKLELTSAAVIRVEQKNKRDDRLDVDDRAQVVVPPPRTLLIGLVTDGQNFFLEKAMTALGLQPADVLAPQQFEAEVPTKYDVIVFDRHTPTKLPASGNFVYFGALPPGLPIRQSVNEAGVPQVTQDVTVLDWKRDHPLLRTLNVSKVFAAEATRLDVPPDAEVIIEGMTTPLLVLYRQSRSTHLVCAFDLLQSNWPMRETFPYFLYNTMQFLALGSDMDVREGYAPGAMPRIPRTNLVRAGGPELRSVSLIGPNGTRAVRVPETGDFVLPPLNRVGLYRTEPSIPQYEQIAVNLLDASESNLLPATVAPGNVGVVDAAGGGKSRFEWWWWLVAVIALPLLMIEWWIYTRRVQV